MGILEIAVVLIIGGFAFRGWKKGFIVTLFTLLSLFIAIIATQIVSPIVSEAVIKNDAIMNTITEQIASLSALWEQPETEPEVISDKKQSKSSKTAENLSKEEKDEIGNLKLPDMFKIQLDDNKMWKDYSQQGIKNVKEYVARYLAITIIKSLCYIIVFAIIITILKMIIKTLDIISKLPVLNSINKFGGIAFGIIQGLIVIWTICIFITMLASTPMGITLFDEINNSPFLSFIYNNNLLMNILLGAGKVLFNTN